VVNRGASYLPILLFYMLLGHRTNEDRPLGVSAGHERHSSNGSVTSIQSVTPPRSPTDLTAALDAPAVFQMAYNEVSQKIMADKAAEPPVQYPC
jgi:hypothetical protein